MLYGKNDLIFNIYQNVLKYEIFYLFEFNIIILSINHEFETFYRNSVLYDKLHLQITITASFSLGGIEYNLDIHSIQD